MRLTIAGIVALAVTSSGVAHGQQPARMPTQVNPRTAELIADAEFRKGTVPVETPGLVRTKVLLKTLPKYTSAAMRADLQGDVVIDAVIDATGTVSRTRIVTSLDTQFGLDDEALKAVRKWLFKPAQLNGTAVPTVERVTLGFWLY